MKLRGIDYGCVLDASGVEGFFGEGYPFHRFLKPFGLSFKGCTFVAKTTTLNSRKGNMRLKQGIVPMKFKPKCIKVKLIKGIVLNSVGLSGPGAKALFEDGRWQQRKDNFFLSFMSVCRTAAERIEELELFVRMFQEYLPDFQGRVGLQINFSCPNVGLDPSKLASEVRSGLEIASALNIPLMPKYNITMPVELAKKICLNENCDAICVSNTIPWGQLPEKIDWQRLYRSNRSPLAHLGGGGLSGRPLLALVADWVAEARDQGIEKPINAGGGILCPKDAATLFNAGASSVFIGSMAVLRGWRVRRTIKRAHQISNRKGEKKNG